MNTRIHQLDALRGLAAFSVVFHHCLLVFPAFFAANFHKEIPSIISILTYSPFHLLWAGHEAVILFFVLSGFVLSLPYFNGSSLPYKNYLIKRIIRLYIPYIVSIIISALLMMVISQHGIDSLSTWFNGMWSKSLNIRDWMKLIFVLDKQPTHNINTATWSLIYEMQISIVFPLLAVFVRRTSWKMALVFTVILALVRKPIIHYMAFFVLGAIIAKYMYTLKRYVKNSSYSFQGVLLCLSLILYLNAWLNPFGLLKTNYLDLLTGLGSALLIVSGVCIEFISKVLSHSWIVRLGEISYSLYLVHTIILLAMVYLFYQWIPIYVILVFVPIVAIFISVYFYRFIEYPTINLGRKIGVGFKLFSHSN